MYKKVTVELEENQLYYVTKILGFLTERQSLDILEGKLNAISNKEEKQRLLDLIEVHEHDKGYSFNTFSSLADQYEEITGFTD